MHRWNMWISIAAVCVLAAGCEFGVSDNSEALAPAPNTTGQTEQSSNSSTSNNSPAPTSSTTTAVAADAIDPSSVHWLGTNPSSWPVTSRLSVSIGGGKINLNYDAARTWPSKDGVNANPWVFVNRGGTWYAATFEYLRAGQTSKPTSTVRGDHIKVAPLNNFVPVSGEVYGFMVSTLARGGLRTIDERTNIVLATWP